MSSQVREKQNKKRLGERLVDAGLIDEIQLAVALGMQKQTGLKIGKQLLKLGFINEEELSPFLSEQTDMSISLAQRKISPQTLKSVPQDLAFKYKVMPVAFDGKTIVLAMGDPKDVTVIDALGFRLGKKIHPVRALEWDIDTALLKYYSDFTDEELSKLTASSSTASQYHSTQWLEKDEEYIKLSKGLDAETDSFDDITDLLEQGDTPDLYMPGNENWTTKPDGGAAGSGPDASNSDKVAPNPLHELEPESAKPPPAPKAKRAAPQPNPLHEKPAPQQTQPEAKSPQHQQPAQQPKQQAPQPQQPHQTPQSTDRPASGQSSSPEKEQPSAASDAISALASTARKRFTVQQALIDLLIEKKIITERDLLNKLIKLEGAVGDEE